VKYKYRLPDTLISQISRMEEFANGATQVSIQLLNGSIFSGVLISDATYVVAARGFNDLPFKLDEIDTAFQTADDKNPATRGDWQYWDEWGV
jgi:hypothetical protein